MPFRLHPKHAIAAVANNGMMYKDITQWLRQRTFAVMFLGLLAVCELLTVTLGLAKTDAAQDTGSIMFGILTGMLFVYGLITTFTGYISTAREFGDHTFELYALAGMSLEKMVFGKLLSMLSQLFLGACCIVPFMFFAYLLGGVDFYLIFTTLALVMLMATPVFLFSLLLSTYQKGKSLRVIISLGIFMMFLVGRFVFYLLMMSFRGGSGWSGVNFIPDLLAGKFEAWVQLVVMGIYYVQICLLLFFMCANAMRPTTDSREHLTKLLLFTLLLSWAINLAYSALKLRLSTDWSIMFFSVCDFLVLFTSVAYFFSPIRVPIMAQIREQAVHGKITPRAIARRVVYFWFQPGPSGYFRMLLLIETVAIGMAIIVAQIDPTTMFAPVPRSIWYQVSLPVSAPFFIAFPAIFFYHFRKTARMKNCAALVILIWVLAFGACMILFSIQETRRSFIDRSQASLLPLISTVASPLISPFSEQMSRRTTDQPLYFIRYIMGGIGIVMMWVILRRRRALDAELRFVPGAAVLPASVALPTPLGVSVGQLAMAHAPSPPRPPSVPPLPPPPPSATPFNAAASTQTILSEPPASE